MLSQLDIPCQQGQKAGLADPQSASRYAVRVAVVSLDQPPAWFQRQAQDHLSAAEARQISDTAGEAQSSNTCLPLPAEMLLQLSALPVPPPWQSSYSGAICPLVCPGLTPQLQCTVHEAQPFSDVAALVATQGLCSC